MRLRTALNEFKRNRDGRFPAECRTIDGAFSAHGDRLVYVEYRHNGARTGLNVRTVRDVGIR